MEGVASRPQAHPLSPPQARSRIPGQRLWGQHHAGSGLHTGLTSRGWVPSGLAPLWDVNSLPSPEGVFVSTFQVTLHPQSLLLAFGTLILRGRKMGRRGESSNIPGTWNPERVDKGRTPSHLSPQAPGQGLLFWRGQSPFENQGALPRTMHTHTQLQISQAPQTTLSPPLGPCGPSGNP